MGPKGSFSSDVEEVNRTHKAFENQLLWQGSHRTCWRTASSCVGSLEETQTPSNRIMHMAFHLHLPVTVTLWECSNQHCGVILYPYSRPLPLLLCKQPTSLNPTLYIRNEERGRSKKMRKYRKQSTLGLWGSVLEIVIFNPIGQA